MTSYEKIAIVLSIIAILVPQIQNLWKKYAVKTKLKHMHTGRVMLFNNNSGSYLYIQSVFEAQKKAISITSIALTVRRKNDSAMRNYTWSTIKAPYNYIVAGNSAAASEYAHPFRIDADQIACSFTEYADENNTFYHEFQAIVNELEMIANRYKNEGNDYSSAYKKYFDSDEYRKASIMLEQELYWKEGEYLIHMEVSCSGEKYEYEMSFCVSNEQYMDLLTNNNTIVELPLKKCYGVPWQMKPVESKLVDGDKVR